MYPSAGPTWRRLCFCYASLMGGGDAPHRAAAMFPRPVVQRGGTGAMSSRQPDNQGCLHQRTQGACVPELVTTYSTNIRRRRGNIHAGRDNPGTK